MVKNSLIRFSYFLENSPTYTNVRNKVTEVLEDHTSIKKRNFDILMIILVLLSVCVLLVEVKHTPSWYLIVIEDIAISVFIVEWLARLWISSSIHKTLIEEYEHAQFLGRKFELHRALYIIYKQKIDFIFSPMSIIDLLSILPYYRPLRMIRILLLFRLFKILRYTNSVSQFGTIFKERKFDFYTLLLMFAIVTFFGASVMYIFEGNGINKNVSSFFDAIYWAVITVATVGYGDISPVTVEGRVATMFLVMGGFSVIVFGSSIVTSSMMEKLSAIKEDRALATVSKWNNFIVICGFTQVARELCRTLFHTQERFVILDSKENLAQELEPNEKEYLFIQTDFTNHELFEGLMRDKKIQSFMALTSNDALNASIILSARAINSDVFITSMVNISDNEKKLKLAGANQTILINKMASEVTSSYIKHQLAYEAIENILTGFKGSVVGELYVDASLVNMRLGELRFTQYKIIVLGLIDLTGEFIFNPKDDFVLSNGQILLVIGFEKYIKDFKIAMRIGK